jgi:TonB family protein
MVEDTAPANEPAGETPTVAVDEAPQGPVPVEAAAAADADLFGSLAADQRIRSAAVQNERTLWARAIAVCLLYAGIIALQVMGLGGFAGIERDLEQREKERRGQDATAISVELVPDPDKDAKTKRWQDGLQSPSPAPPQPQQSPSRQQPEVEAKPTEQQEQDEPTNEEAEHEKEVEGGQPSLPSLEAMVDAAADNLTQQIKRHYEKKPQEAKPERQAMYSGGGMKVRGVGASGKSDEFSKSVIAELMRTRPGPFALWGRVLVSFQISERGELAYVHLVHSSGNRALDQAAIEAIKKARFEIPPPGLSPDARTYIIDYIFG